MIPISPRAVVIGASSGIGEATVRALAALGFHVVCAVRRDDRIRHLADEIGGTIVNISEGAHGHEPIESAAPEMRRATYGVDVIGATLVTRALLPALEASGDGMVVFVGSIAELTPQEGGDGYSTTKDGLAGTIDTLRLELVGLPVRISEIASDLPTHGSLQNRSSDDQSASKTEGARVYDVMAADDIAHAVAWVATRPQHVNVDRLVIRPFGQRGTTPDRTRLDGKD